MASNQSGKPDPHGAVAASEDGLSGSGPATQRPATKIATVSHTLHFEIAERLRHFAFRERISESAVIEFALRELFEGGEADAKLGARLREAGAALRRKT